MLAFVTSLRARALARDWKHHVWMLECTVRSMLAQANPDVMAVIACHDIPETLLASHPQVHFLPVKFPPPERNNDDMCVDKVLKLSVGADWAVAQGCDHVMFIDADDLVSNRIGALVAESRGVPGWYSSSVFFYTHGGRLLRQFRVSGMNALPFVVVRSDLLEFDVPPYTGKWVDIIRRGGENRYLGLLERHGERTCALAAVGLQNYRDYMAGRGQPLEAIPFPSIVMINHSDSTSHVPGGTGAYASAGKQQRASLRMTLSRFKQSLRWLPTFRLLTPKLRREFSIPQDSEIPPAYLHRGSIFWR